LPEGLARRAFRSASPPPQFGTGRLTGALLGRLTHHVHIPEMNRDNSRLGQSRARQADASV